MIGIDTPEIYSKQRIIAADIKAIGEHVRAALQLKLDKAGNQLSLSYGQDRFDRYGRTLAHVFLPDGENIQAWLVSRGYAIAFTTPPNDRMSDCYGLLEVAARKAAKGIWKIPQYQLKYSHQLNKDSHGFHRLQARVNGISERKNKLVLQLDNNIEINIYKENLVNFSLHMLKMLKGKNVRVRGWLKQKKSSANSQHANRYSMTVRHPDAITEQRNTK